MTSLAGQGFVAIWNGIPSEREDDFKNWHKDEHMPERLAVPGFLRGTRWKGDQLSGGFFTLYILESPEVARSRPYLERLNAPTPWTKSIMADFTENARCVGAIAWSVGDAPSSRMAVVRLGSNALLPRALGEHILAISGVTGCHFGQSDTATSALATVERQGRAVAEPLGLLAVVLDENANGALVAENLNALLPDAAANDIAIFEREFTLP